VNGGGICPTINPITSCILRIVKSGGFYENKRWRLTASEVLFNGSPDSGRIAD